MIIRKCDRCGEMIKDSYWIISISEKKEGIIRSTPMKSLNDIEEAFKERTNRQEEYCEECIDNIKEFIRNKQKR